MSFGEAYSIVLAASRSGEPGPVMAKLTQVDMGALNEQEIAILYGLVTKDMPCLSVYLPPNKRKFALLIQNNAIPVRQPKY